MKTTSRYERIPWGLSRRDRDRFADQHAKIYLVIPIPVFWYGPYYRIEWDDMRIGWQYLLINAAWWKPALGVLGLAGHVIAGMVPIGEGKPFSLEPKT